MYIVARTRFPRHVEITLGHGAGIVVREWYDFDFSDLLELQLLPIFEDVGFDAQNEVSAEAPAGAHDFIPGSAAPTSGLRWWQALHVRRWPVLTGKSSAQLGRSFLFGSGRAGETIEFYGQRPSGPELYYMEEIEHEGRDSLFPIFLLDEKIRRKLGDRLRNEPGLISRTLAGV